MCDVVTLSGSSVEEASTPRTTTIVLKGRHRTCMAVQCNSDKLCTTQWSSGDTKPSPNIVRCEPRGCQHGVALLDTNRRTIQCGRVQERRSCPSQYHCAVHPTDEYAFCCPDENEDPCKAHSCASGEVCVAVEVQCITEPCPVVAECRAGCQHGAPLLNINRVHMLCGPNGRSCPNQYQCITDQLDGFGFCCPDDNVDPCKTHSCSDGEECVAVDLPGYYCTGRTPPCTLAECRAASGTKYDPCKNHKCSEGEVCSAEEVVCKKAPCPPVAQCMPGCQHGKALLDINRVQILCGSGPNSRSCPSQYQCIADPLDAYAFCCPDENVDPCKKHRCSSFEECIAVEVQCITEPCPPVAECRPWKKGTIPLTNSDPCKLIDCGNDETCITETSPCETEPCPVEGRCVPTDGSGSCSNIYSSVSNLLIFVLVSLLILTQ